MQHVEDISCFSLPFFGKLVKDYLSGRPELDAFYDARPSLEGLKETLANKQFTDANRKLLVTSLKEQYGNLLDADESAAVRNYIHSLEKPNTFTITTGHQLCAYGGPAYFIYKIASAVQLSRSMKQQMPEYEFVPVFWMASEDHDFGEISNLYLWGKSWQWKDENQPIAGTGPVGRLHPDALSAWGTELKNYFRDEAVTSQVIDVISGAYAANESLSAATRQWVHHLFKAWGLVIVDGDHPGLKGAFKEIISKELQTQCSYKALTVTSEKQKDLGYEAQVSGREINLFYFNAAGQRERIESDGSSYRMAQSGTVYSAEQMLALVETNPENFSPNVVLRPVYQERILPNIAYIGGPGEVAYWLQLKEVFGAFSVPLPVVVLRSSHLFLPKSLYELRQKHGFSVEQLLTTGYDDLVKIFLAKQNPEFTGFPDEEELLVKTASLLKLKAGNIDKILAEQTDIELKGWLDSLSRLKVRFNKALKSKSESDLKQLKRLKNTLMPEGELQERRISILEFMSQNPEWLQQIIENSNPLPNTLNLFVRE